MSAFFSFDKDFHPVFIDYCLMSHPDYTVREIHLSTTHCRPFVAWNVCVCLNFCLLPVNDVAAIHSMRVFVCECAVHLCASKQHASTPNTNPRFLLHEQESKSARERKIAKSFINCKSPLMNRYCVVSKHIQYRVMINMSTMLLIFALFGGCKTTILKR